jgi:hypothetical protein
MTSTLWAQSSRLTISYKDGNTTKEQTFNLDSVSSYGYNLIDQTVFVQPFIGAKFGIPYSDFIAFIYPSIMTDSAGVSGYLVVNVDGQKAAFLLEPGFEMTWKGGVLAIKDKKQSQSIGLKNGISFTVEKLSFGYTNPNISSTPGTGTWYLVMDNYFSIADNIQCRCIISQREYLPAMEFSPTYPLLEIGIKYLMGETVYKNMYWSTIPVGDICQ